MSVEQILLKLEEEGGQALVSGKAAEFYGRLLTDDAQMVVPGMRVDKQMFVQAAGGDPWQSFRIEDARVLQLTEDCAALTYKATGTRPGRPEYVALMTSIYVARDGTWRLAHHQQTPMPGA